MCHIEMLPADESASADKEHLDYRILCLNRQCDNILILSVKIGDLLLL